MMISESHEVLAESIVSLYRDEAKRSELRKKGKDFVDSKFDLDKNVARIFELYK